jgi:hypothetical protein
MHSLKQVLVSMVAVALVMVASSAAGMARGYRLDPMAHHYGGSWTVTVTGSQSNWTGCLTLGASDSASLVIGSQKYPYGSYFILNDLLVATVTAQGYGQNAGLVFIGRADGPKIGKGVYEEVYGGSNFQSGSLTFGAKGSC